MSVGNARFTPAWAFALAAVGYGLVIYALLPGQVIVLDDDFGYLKSILQTLQHGRPWTNDFLEPWNAASSSISAAAFALTGNFYFATYGLQAVFAAAAFGGLCLLLSSRGFSVRTTLALAALMLTFPVMLWRALEYTGMVLYVPCLLGAIWAAERRRWGLFAFVWVLAALNRQSAAVWLALPAYAAGRELFSRSGGGAVAARIPGAVVVGGVVLLGVAHLTMNATDAQRMLLHRTAELFQPLAALRTLSIGASIFLVSTGLGVALLTLSRESPQPRPAWRGMALGGMLALAALFLLRDLRFLTNLDHVDVRWQGGWLYSKLLVALGLAGWIGFRFRLQPAFVLCAAASALLVCLRASIGDYYFIDAALLGFFAVVPGRAEGGGAERSSLLFFRWWKPGLVAGLGLIGLFHLQSALYLKTVVDEARAITSLYEQALRAGKIRAHETIDAPFGYSGWHLYAHAIEHRTSTRIRWFSALIIAPVKSVELAASYPGSLPRRWRSRDGAGPDPQLEPLAEVTARIGWFWSCRYVLQRRAPPREPDPLGPGFQPIVFPQNNAEWRELAAGPVLP